MHRSGTSALAGALHRVGADFGSDLVAAQADNVRGYYEHRQVLALHEELFAAAASSWDDVSLHSGLPSWNERVVTSFQQQLATVLSEQFSQAALWAVKDPRLCRLLPLWLPILDQLGATPRLIMVSRTPAEVAASLARRDGFSREKSGLLWVEHTLLLEKASRGLCRALVSYEQLLTDPAAVVDQLGRDLDLEWPRSTAEAGPELDAFIDPDLRHEQLGEAGSADWGRVAPVLEPLAELLPASFGADGSEQLFDSFHQQFSQIARAIDPIVLEHLHQFGRREVERRLWSVGSSLQRQLDAVAEQLGAGLEQADQRLTAFVDDRELTARTLERRAQAAAEAAAGTDSTLRQFATSLEAAEGGVSYLSGELESVRATIDRWQDDVDLERRLDESQQAQNQVSNSLEYLSHSLDDLGARVADLSGQLERMNEQIAAVGRSRGLWLRAWASLRSRFRGKSAGSPPPAAPR